jgi:two-component system response regulator YesN
MYNVLLVDDEPWVIESYKRKVDWEQHGFTVSAHAPDGFKALDIIRASPPDLIISDIRMPGMTGMELIKRVKMIKNDIEIIMMSGYAEFTYVQQAINEGAVGYCLKPLNPAELIGLLKRTRETLQQRDVSINRPERDKEEVKTDPSSKHELISQILGFVKENYHHDISLYSISQQFHLNLSYASYLFKKETGVTFSHYVTELRMRLACDLLAGSNLKIQDIAAKTGYHDYFYFTKLFKRTMHTTPSSYRLQIKA